MSWNLVGRATLILAFIASSVLTARLFTHKIPNFDSQLEFIGLERIAKPELLAVVDGLNLDGKSFIQINAQSIKKSLEKRPLIKSIKVRPLLLPKKVFKVYIEEEKPWALYGSEILNQEGKTIVKSQTQAMLFGSPAIETLYADFKKRKKGLVSISSYTLLNENEIMVIKKAADIITSNLKLISKADNIEKIIIDHENNLKFKSSTLNFKTGPLNQETLERVKRLNMLVGKLKDLSKHEDIAYVDLSLGTGEVIIGKS